MCNNTSFSVFFLIALWELLTVIGQNNTITVYNFSVFAVVDAVIGVVVVVVAVFFICLQWYLQEWGDPNIYEVYEYQKSYSAYENIAVNKLNDSDRTDNSNGNNNNNAPTVFPHVFLTCGIHDPRVPFWDAAKMTAKLRCVTYILIKNHIYTSLIVIPMEQLTLT